MNKCETKQAEQTDPQLNKDNLRGWGKVFEILISSFGES